MVLVDLDRRMSKSSRRSSAVPGGVRALAGGQPPARTQSLPLSATRNSMPLSLSGSLSSSFATRLSSLSSDLKRTTSLPPHFGSAESADAAEEGDRGEGASSRLRQTLVLHAQPQQKRVHSAEACSADCPGFCEMPQSTTCISMLRLRLLP